MSVQTELLTEASDLLSDMKVALAALIEATDKASAMGGGREQAEAYHGVVAPRQEALRAPADRLEMIVDKDLWPMPSYGDLIFRGIVNHYNKRRKIAHDCGHTRAMGRFFCPDAAGRWRSLRALPVIPPVSSFYTGSGIPDGVISSRRTKALIKWLVV